MFAHIKRRCPTTRVVFQIARGRAAQSMYDEVIAPLARQHTLAHTAVFGYRSTDYYEFDLDPDQSPFVFVNIGMFAVLSQSESVPVGTLCNPVHTCEVIRYSHCLGFETAAWTQHMGPANLLDQLELPQIVLYGIADDMPFAVPSVYAAWHVRHLVQTHQHVGTPVGARMHAQMRARHDHPHNINLLQLQVGAGI